MPCPKLYCNETIDLQNIAITLIEVYEGIQKLKDKTSSGQDGVPNVLLKGCVCALSNPIHYLFHLSLNKAFDRVNHQLLINKLKVLGFGEKIICWVYSFLNGQHHRVRINNYISGDIEVSSGVPQGLHCAPSLFSLFINDLKQIIKDVDFFADNLKLFHKVNDASNRNVLLRNLDTLFNWTNKNLLELNIDKCYVIYFSRGRILAEYAYSINNTLLKRITEIKDLGVVFDQQLTFKKHMQEIRTSAHWASL